MQRIYIREWRRYRRMKQSTLAAETGFSEATISKIENGKQTYTNATLVAIAEALGTKPGYLLEFNPHLGNTIWASVRDPNFIVYL